MLVCDRSLLATLGGWRLVRPQTSLLSSTTQEQTHSHLTMLHEEHAAMCHEPSLIFNKSFFVFHTHQESAIDDRRLLFDNPLPTFALRNLRNLFRAFTRPISCCSMARVGWSLVTKHIWPPRRASRLPAVSMAHVQQNPSAVPRTLGRRTKCLSPQTRRGSAAQRSCNNCCMSSAGSNTTSHSASVDCQIVTWI